MFSVGRFSVAMESLYRLRCVIEINVFFLLEGYAYQKTFVTAIGTKLKHGLPHYLLPTSLFPFYTKPHYAISWQLFLPTML